MIISPRKKFIFFHVPKAAGSSIERALRKYANFPYARIYNYLIDYLGPRPALNLYPMHVSPAEMRSAKSAEFMDRYMKFAVVRNTWDWHCSQFHFHRKNDFTVFYNEFRTMTFDDYIDWAIEPDNIVRAKALQKRFLSYEEGPLGVDRILRFENLKADFDDLMAETGITASLPHANKSQRKQSYREEYCDAGAEKIATAFKEDIDHFGFRF